MSKSFLFINIFIGKIHAAGIGHLSVDDQNLAAEKKLAIILGTEGTGLTSYTIENCDYTVRIPMQHGVDSLNVAAASAVAFWELRVK